MIKLVNMHSDEQTNRIDTLLTNALGPDKPIIVVNELRESLLTLNEAELTKFLDAAFEHFHNKTTTTH